MSETISINLADENRLVDRAVRVERPFENQVNRIKLAEQRLGIPEEALRQAEWWMRTDHWEVKLDKHGYRAHYKITHQDEFINLAEGQNDEVQIPMGLHPARAAGLRILAHPE